MLEVGLNDLLQYTDWERQKWHSWFREHGNEPLKLSAGPHGDGRFSTIGELVRHVFSAEMRYIDRLSERRLTDASTIPAYDFEALFQFGQQSRKQLREFLQHFPEQKLDVMHDFSILNFWLKATPRKIIVHVVMHEIRHWARSPRYCG